MHFNISKISPKNQVNIVEKTNSKNKSKRSRLSLPRKSVLAVLVFPVTIFLLTGLIMVSSGCSPVSFHLKAGTGGFEFQLQKGSCNLPQLPPQ
ncbi:MAG: hypothetical protein KI793_00225 [Rivularia sp. (in: Bacteria)]|nr:hypothetical protein [Rivularia sp. MS3]